MDFLRYGVSSVAYLRMLVATWLPFFYRLSAWQSEEGKPGCLHSAYVSVLAIDDWEGQRIAEELSERAIECRTRMAGAEGTIVVATSIFSAPIERWGRRARAIRPTEWSRRKKKLRLQNKGK